MRRCPAKSYKVVSMIPCCNPSARFRPVLQRQVASVASFAKPKNELLHDGPPLKSGSLRGRQEVHHEILCAVIQAEADHRAGSHDCDHQPGGRTPCARLGLSHGCRRTRTVEWWEAWHS